MAERKLLCEKCSSASLGSIALFGFGCATDVIIGSTAITQLIIFFNEIVQKFFTDSNKYLPKISLVLRYKKCFSD